MSAAGDARKRLAESVSADIAKHGAVGSERDLVAALREAEGVLAAVRTFADELDAGASLRWTSDVAKELRGVLGGGS